VDTLITYCRGVRTNRTSPGEFINKQPPLKEIDFRVDTVSQRMHIGFNKKNNDSKKETEKCDPDTRKFISQ
jgi:hypothetical protein